MKISDECLRDYIDIDFSAREVGDFLTAIGLEVEAITRHGAVEVPEDVVVGEVLSCGKHPNADRLSLTLVDVGREESLRIVCGAPNVAAGKKVAVALIGSRIPGGDGSFFEIKRSKIRGEYSEGMLCSERECGLGEDTSGILILSDDYELGKPLAQYVAQEGDQVYEIGLTPNRTDAMSHYGVARDLHAYLSCNAFESKLRKIDLPIPVSSGHHEFSLEVEDAELCPRYMGAVIEGVKVEESPLWLKRRLLAVGISPINNVVDISNYVLHAFGQPLHAFDADKIAGKKVVVGLSQKASFIETLDSVSRELNASEILIKDADSRPLCLAGVLGGLDSGVSGDTKTLFLESAYFNPVAIRKAAKLHSISTDASFRFERGVDPNGVDQSLYHAVRLIEEVAGGKLLGKILEFYPKRIGNKTFTLRYSVADQILGLEIPREKIKEILGLLEIGILKESSEALEVSVPTYRTDVTREIDLVEEILRIYGYDKVVSPEKFSFTPTKSGSEAPEKIENYWAEILQSNSFYEVMNNSLVPARDSVGLVKLINPLSKELSCMRSSLLEGLLQNAVYNINRKNDRIKFFEFGKIYSKDPDYKESRRLALLMSGNNYLENWTSPKSRTDFFFLKAYVQLLMEKSGIEGVEEDVLEDDHRFSQGLRFSSGGKLLAKMGLVSGQLLKDADMKEEAFYAEIDLDLCGSLCKNDYFKLRDIPKFNKLSRDLALVVDQDVLYKDLYQSTVGISPYLKKVRLFDVYQGKNLPEGKRSYALSFDLLSEEKTLEESEISGVMNSLIALYREKFNAELRS